MNLKQEVPRRTIKEMRKKDKENRQKVIYEIVTSILELSLFIGCFYGFLMLLVEYRLV